MVDPFPTKVAGVIQSPWHMVGKWGDVPVSVTFRWYRSWTWILASVLLGAMVVVACINTVGNTKNRTVGGAPARPCDDAGPNGPAQQAGRGRLVLVQEPSPQPRPHDGLDPASNKLCRFR